MKSIFLSCLLVLCVTASEAAVLITFDEQPTQPVDGLVVEGVAFQFTVGGSSSPDAVFNSDLPVTTVNLDDKVLSGPVAGLLTFQFSAPVIAFQFGLVLNTLDPEQPAAIISLLDTSLQPAGDLPLDTNPLLLFSEGLFSYAGPAISQVQIAFSGTTAADLFAIDNLEYTAVEVDVPETGTLTLCGLGMLGLGIARFRRN